MSPNTASYCSLTYFNEINYMAHRKGLTSFSAKTQLVMDTASKTPEASLYGVQGELLYSCSNKDFDCMGDRKQRARTAVPLAVTGSSI